MLGCDIQTNCGFFLRYAKAQSQLCKGLVSCYCQGPLWDRCARKGFFVEQGDQPDERMLPSGELLE